MHHRTRIAGDVMSNAVDRAATALKDAPLSDDGVHEARKMLKKARAGLRMHRAVFSKMEYRRHNAALRDAGRLLSPLRDGRTLSDLFERIRGDVGLAQDDRMPARIALLLRDRLSQARHVFDTSEAQARATQTIAAIRNAIDRIKPLDATALLDGLRKIFRKARRAFDDACDDDTQKTRHELRKQTKYLRSAFSEFDAPRAAKVTRRARRIAKWLGEDHDLSELRATIEQERKRNSEGSDLIGYIRRRQKKLQRKAFKAGKRLFEKRPKAFVATISGNRGKSQIQFPAANGKRESVRSLGNSPFLH